MYNQQGYNGGSVYGASYGMDYQQYYYQQQQQQQQQVPQHQQRIAGVMGYYSPDAAAMFYNPYVYGAQQQMAQPQQPVDYQLTPALYLLNQQAELLQRSLHRTTPPQSRPAKRNTSKAKDQGPSTKALPRKTRGPYKRRANKSLSPSTSPAPEQPDTSSDRLSTSDVSGSNNRSSSSIQSLDQQQQSAERKRKSDSFLELEQQTKRQFIDQTPSPIGANSGLLRERRQSIFCSVALMAESSCTKQR
ncbi:vacuolar protein-sorting-associated protein 36-like [Anopheles ziemanni]|uniref:vacuolar protein-sorting-associated protein 36-like n=1 Tax=Anopheles coustani TaxID=139045 RepID=UPI00265A5511|nr:vacuolar protein-sorting-associated protein 36-like [Anopheles coustani]XP_058177162.1 vacuolar protein-sorting-associated protein 36-like [Anopheles ziemanni]